MNPSLPQQIVAGKNNPQETFISKKRDTYTLAKLERDPFLGIIQQKKEPAKIRQDTIYRDWPPIYFKGIIIRNNSQEKLFIINIGTKQFMVKEGQSMDSLKLLGGNENRITIQYKNVAKEFRISK